MGLTVFVGGSHARMTTPSWVAAVVRMRQETVLRMIERGQKTPRHEMMGQLERSRNGGPKYQTGELVELPARAMESVAQESEARILSICSDASPPGLTVQPVSFSARSDGCLEMSVTAISPQSRRCSACEAFVGAWPDLPTLAGTTLAAFHDWRLRRPKSTSSCTLSNLFPTPDIAYNTVVVGHTGHRDRRK